MIAKDWWNGLQDSGGFVVLGLPKTEEELGVLVEGHPSHGHPLDTAAIDGPRQPPVGKATSYY
jgi:hypothetical protein